MSSCDDCGCAIEECECSDRLDPLGESVRVAVRMTVQDRERLRVRAKEAHLSLPQYIQWRLGLYVTPRRAPR